MLANRYFITIEDKQRLNLLNLKKAQIKLGLDKMKHTYLRDSIVVASTNQISSDLGEEVVILNLKDGVYHGLDSVGARIWKLLQDSKTVEDILNILLEEYDVELERCERDLLALLEKLGQEGLIEVKDATAA